MILVTAAPLAEPRDYRSRGRVTSREIRARFTVIRDTLRWREISLSLSPPPRGGRGIANAPRVAYRGEHHRALDAESCVLLTLFGSTRVSPHRGRAHARSIVGGYRS